MRPTQLAALCLFVSGCLSNPEPQAPGNVGTNGATNNAATNNAATNNAATNNAATNNAATNNAATNNAASNNGTAGGDDGAPCAPCALEETQCVGTSYQVCDEAEGKACNYWRQDAACVGDQRCTVDVGCTCIDECDLGAEPTCTATGVTICAFIDGCAKEVEIGRADGCPAPTTGCTADSDLPWCNECGDGRSCVQQCPHAAGYICGSAAN